LSARKDLTSLGVEVKTGQHVTGIDQTGVSMGEERVRARTVVWSAGVTASTLGAKVHAPLDKAGRVKVTRALTVPGHEQVFAVGDLAYVEQDGKLVPGVAPAAIQMGKHAARNILRRVRGEPYLPFVFKDRGTFAVVGRGAAVGVAFRRFQLSGLFAWLAWLFIHLFFLVGFRNRFFVLLKWGYAYLTMRRYARLITGVPGNAPKGSPSSGAG
jgi:NADH dehydrogenase